MKLLKIGSVEIPQYATLDLEPVLSPIGGEYIRRTISGAGIKQSTWRKTRIMLSGGGWAPAGLDALDYTVQHAVALITPRAVNCNVSREATLPAARRADTGYTPFGVAYLDNGGTATAAVVMVDNVATLDAVSGAIGYAAMYYPLINCWIFRPTESGSRGDASYRWELVAEEV